MKLVGNEADRGRIVGAVNRYRCTFEFGTPPTSIESQNLLQTQFIVGDPVVVSTEDGNFALGLGFVVEITTRKIVLALDHPLTGNRVRSQQFSEEDNQDIEGISVFQNGTGWKPPAESTSANDVLYRIDKDEMQGAMGTLRNNLVQLFVSNGDHRRRELIVDLRQPRFSATVDLDEFAGPELLKGLNPDQRQALKKVASGEFRATTRCGLLYLDWFALKTRSSRLRLDSRNARNGQDPYDRHHHSRPCRQGQICPSYLSHSFGCRHRVAEAQGFGSEICSSWKCGQGWLLVWNGWGMLNMSSHGTFGF